MGGKGEKGGKGGKAGKGRGKGGDKRGVETKQNFLHHHLKCFHFSLDLSEAERDRSKGVRIRGVGCVWGGDKIVGKVGREDGAKYLVASSSANLFFSSFFVSDSFFICCFTSSSSDLET